MGRAPNQKQIYVHKPSWNKDFLVVGRDEWHKVANIDTNSKSVLITYLYLLDNKDGHVEEFSPANMVKSFGKDRKTWQRAIEILEEEGYLIHVEGEAQNNFHFYATPQVIEQKINIDCSFKEFVTMDESEQTRIYNAILDIDWKDMTKEQEKIHNYYVEYVIED